MKRGHLKHHWSQSSAQHERGRGLERMRRYLEATRPAFEKTVLLSKTVGNEANGVLAGPSRRVNIK